MPEFTAQEFTIQGSVPQASTEQESLEESSEKEPYSDKISLGDPVIGGRYKRLDKSNESEEDERSHVVPCRMEISNIQRDSTGLYGPTFDVHSVTLLDDDSRPLRDTSKGTGADLDSQLNSMAQEQINGMFPNHGSGASLSASGGITCHTLAPYYESETIRGGYTLSFPDLPAKYRNFKSINMSYLTGQQILRYDNNKTAEKRRKSKRSSKSSHRHHHHQDEDKEENDKLTVEGNLHCILWPTDSTNKTYGDYIKQLPTIKSRLVAKRPEEDYGTSSTQSRDFLDEGLSNFQPTLGFSSCDYGHKTEGEILAGWEKRPE